MKPKKPSPFRSILSSILVGLLTAVLLYVDAGRPVEFACFQLRNRVAQLVTPASSQPALTVIELSDNSTESAGKQSDASLSKAIDLVAHLNPLALVLYVDLRRSKLSRTVLDSIKRQSDKIVVSYRGIDEVSPNAYGQLLEVGIKCGYAELPLEHTDIAGNLPLKFKPAQGGINPQCLVPPLATAIVEVAYPTRKQAWLSRADSYPAGTQFLIDFVARQNVKHISLDELSNNADRLGPDSISNRIVVLAASEPGTVQTPLAELMTPLSVHLQAIGTWLTGVHLVNFDTIAAWLVLPFGALIGALFYLLKPIQRINAVLIAFFTIIIVGQISFELLHVVIPTMAPLTVILACYAACSLIFLEVEDADRSKGIALSLEARTEEERKRISQEIHDDTLPSLTQVKRIAKSMKGSTATDSTPDQICDLLDLTVNDMRRLVDDLHPLALENLGLDPAIEALVGRFARHTKIAATYSGKSAPTDTMPPSAKLSIYRMVQEALNNIEKHSDASLVEVQLSKAGDWLTISVADNGNGFCVESVSGHSHGLTNVRERAQLINATVAWRAPDAFDHGTEMIIKVKLV